MTKSRAIFAVVGFAGALISANMLAHPAGAADVTTYHYDNLRTGWNQNELLALLGIYFILSGCIQAFIRPNMERLIEQIHRGTLDLMLTKPEDSQLLVSTQVFAFWQSLDMVTGLIVLVVAAVRLHVELEPGLLPHLLQLM